MSTNKLLSDQTFVVFFFFRFSIFTAYYRELKDLDFSNDVSIPPSYVAQIISKSLLFPVVCPFTSVCNCSKGCGSLFRIRFVIPNTQISYTWTFVNPNICSVIPKVRYTDGLLFRRFVFVENEIGFHIPEGSLIGK